MIHVFGHKQVFHSFVFGKGIW